MNRPDRWSYCAACREAIDVGMVHDGNRLCADCYAELKHGIVPAAFGPIILDTEPEPNDYVESVDVGEWDNAVRTTEDRETSA